MTGKKLNNQQILEKAILKAANDSWIVPSWILVEIKYNNWNFVADERIWPTIIFNHNFAKALWPITLLDVCALCGNHDFGGNKNPYTVCNSCLEEREDWQIIPQYQYHLRQMVIAEDPIQYLGENLPEA